MPTYEYECERCKKTFEVDQKISDPPLKECALPAPNGQPCGGEVKRLIGSTSFVLKGSGWFKDGY
jgi:putative FmdB family regulatory protein